MSIRRRTSRRSRRRPRSESAADGNPACTSSSRVRVSCGDSAPPSIRSSGRSQAGRSRVHRRWRVDEQVARHRRPASWRSPRRRAVSTARMCSSSRRPRSKAVRAASWPACHRSDTISSSTSMSRWITMPSTRRSTRRTTRQAGPASIHFVPCRAGGRQTGDCGVADCDHNHAPTACVAGVSGLAPRQIDVADRSAGFGCAACAW